jgi:hypothetical protein
MKEFSDMLLSRKHGEGVEAKEIDCNGCISEKQTGWLHCKDGPIMYLVDKGWDFYVAKRFLKVHYGRKIFVRDMTDENCNKLKGYFFWECRATACRSIVHPHNAISAVNKRLCPNCHSILHPISIKSINDVAVSRIKLWNDTIWEAYPEIKRPDPEQISKPKQAGYIS